MRKILLSAVAIASLFAAGCTSGGGAPKGEESMDDFLKKNPDVKNTPEPKRESSPFSTDGPSPDAKGGK